MAFRFSRREALGAGVRRLADAELSAASALLRDDTTAADLRVHGARKATKRVRALLRLVRAGLPAPQFRAANLGLRDAARELSAARDAAVALATFDDLVSALDDTLAPVRAALLAAATRDPAPAPDTPSITDPAAPTPADPVLAGAAASLDQVRAHIDQALAQRPIHWRDLATGLDTTYRAGRTAMRAAFTSPDDEVFHAWRKRVKDLWYQTQLVIDACEPALGALEQMLDELGDRLGADHDLAVLAAQPAAADLPALAALIADRRKSLRSDAWDLGRLIYAERPRAFLRRVAAYWQVWRTADPF